MFERIQHHRSVFFPAILAMGILCFSFITGCETQTREEESEYVPISLFTPAYNALSEKSSGDEYDLNATIRVIHGLELARYQSEDFESFLDYLTRQDYRGVAEDVLEAQRKMFPVLQQMYCVSRENEEIMSCLTRNWWKTVTEALRDTATTWPRFRHLPSTSATVPHRFP